MKRLEEHQLAILAQLAEASALLDGDPAPGGRALARLRWQMVRLLRSYQLFKHVEIFDPAIAAANAERALLAVRLKEGCITAEEEFRRYVQRWSAADVVTCWSDYRVAACTMIGRLRRHLNDERRQVEVLLAGAPRTRRQSA